MNLLRKYTNRLDFDSYEDFKENFRILVPEKFNFGYDIVDEWSKLDPEKKALVWCDDAGNKKEFTFTDVSKLSNKIAGYLKSVGISKGDVVLLILRRRWEYWLAATALHKLGAILIPGSLQLTEKDIKYRAKMAGIKAIIHVDDPFVNKQIEVFDGFKCTNDALMQNIESFPDVLEEKVETSKDDVMLIYFTSGTTGMPKMVQHNFTYPLGHIITAHFWQQVKENKLHMSVSDSGWAKFGWGKIYGQWICGAVIFAYDMEKFVPSKLLEKMSEYKLTTFCAPPTMYRFMLQEDVASYDLSSIENFCTAGEPLNPEVFRKWKEITGKEMREGFGQSEGPVLLANFPWLTPKPGSMGKPSPIYNIELLTSEGAIAENGEEGIITICNVKSHPPVGLFTGFYKNPEMTKTVLGIRDYDTGDVAYTDENGYYWFIGRNDDVIKCSGYRIGPFEVESAILEHEACVECAVTAAPDPIRGQVVKATIVLKKGYTGSAELIKEIQNYVKKVTAPYKYPRIIEFVDELPKTLGGKIKRKEIREKN
ncbi:MAG: AMP-binding protein [Ruminococcus sp.]|jgi:acetyl-CoA synthetase|nr:AMP-binding protein [Ruminococcus sp.]